MDRQDKRVPKRDFRFDILYFVAALFAVLLIRDYLATTDHVREITYREFRQHLDKNDAKDIVVGPTRINDTLPLEADVKEPQHFTTVRVDSQIADELSRRGITSAFKEIQK